MSDNVTTEKCIGYWRDTAPSGTSWLEEIRAMECGEHTDPAGFFASVRRLTEIEYAMSELLVEDYAHSEPGENETWGEHLWFHTGDREPSVADGWAS